MQKLRLKCNVLIYFILIWVNKILEVNAFEKAKAVKTSQCNSHLNDKSWRNYIDQVGGNGRNSHF
jgi:hypothetical protein